MFKNENQSSPFKIKVSNYFYVRILIKSIKKFVKQAIIVNNSS